MEKIKNRELACPAAVHGINWCSIFKWRNLKSTIVNQCSIFKLNNDINQLMMILEVLKKNKNFKSKISLSHCITGLIGVRYSN